MDIKPILTDLKAEQPPQPSHRRPKQAKKRGLTPAGRRRLSEKMKARWAARRKQIAKPAPQKTSGRRTMSPAARKKIAEAQRKRWAARKKAAKAS